MFEVVIATNPTILLLTWHDSFSITSSVLSRECFPRDLRALLCARARLAGILKGFYRFSVYANSCESTWGDD